MERVTLSVNNRSILGKKVQALRRQNITPVHLYGPGVDSRSLQAESQTLTKIVAQVGTNIPISLQVDDESGPVTVFVREIQIHPITEQILHVDFYQVDVTQKMEVSVPVTLEGEAPAVKLSGGSLMQLMHSLTVECLPMDVPESIKIDISSLDSFEKAIRVADLNLGESVIPKADADEMIVRVAPPRVEEVVTAEAAAQEVEIAKADEAGEGKEEEQEKG